MAADLLGLPMASAMLDAASAQGLDLRAALDGDEESLRSTDVAQPALLLVSCACAAALGDALEIAGVAGHSVGEYAACVVAGALDPADAMGLVIARGRAMVAMREGSMAAVLGLDTEAVAALCDDVHREQGETVVVANINAPAQVVISGSRAGVDAASQRARDAGARRVVPLNVSGAFHSPLMEEAAARFARDLDAVRMREPRVPIVCNVDAAPVRDAETLRLRLRAQLTSPVRWIECVRALVALGATTLIEAGPGTVLTGLARRIAPEVRALSVGSRAQASDVLAQLQQAHA